MLAASRSSTSKEHWKEVELAALKTIVKKEIGEPAWKDLQVELEVTVAGIYDTLMGSDCLAGGEKLGCCVLHGENKTCDEHRAAAEALYKKHGGDVIENVNAFCKEGKKMEEKKGKTETRPWSSRTLMGPPRPLLTVTGARHPCSIL